MDKKISLAISATALFIALVSGAWQLSLLVKGADIILLPPNQVVIFAFTYPNNENRYVGFNIPMTYVNKGGRGYDAIVKLEYIEVVLDHTYKMQWSLFESFTWEEYKKERKPGSTPTYKKLSQSTAIPFVVPGQSAATHETTFYPLPTPIKNNQQTCFTYSNFLLFQKFSELIASCSKLEIYLKAEVIEDGTIQVKTLKLTVCLDDNLRKNLNNTLMVSPPTVCQVTMRDLLK